MASEALSADERLARLLTMQTVVTRVAREIGPALELQPVLTTILRAMRSLFEFKGGTICLVENDHVYIAASDPGVSPEVAALRLPVGSGLAGRCVASGSTIYSPDLDGDPRVDQAVRKLGSNAAMKSYLAVPLICLGEVIGLMQVDSARPDAFGPDEIVMFEGLAAQAAGAIESARRHEAVLELARLKSDFLARVSHELRTPLTVVSGFTDTLAARWRTLDEETRDEILGRMRVASDRLRHLIEELLQASSFEAGTAALHRRQVDLGELLDAIARATDPVQVRVHCPPGLRFETDPDVLRQAVTMTVENALVYAGDAVIDVSSVAPLVIDVRDHGPGIPAALRNRVFERFVRGQDESPGMGLGLSLVRVLAGALGGHVEAVDPPGGLGACFRFSFPQAAVPLGGEDPAVSRPSSRR